MPTRVTSVEEVSADPPYLFTVEGPRGDEVEVLLVPCEDGIEAWVNRCTHETQRLDEGDGSALRDGELVCPRHGSLFDACGGDCDNGPAAGTTLLDVDVTVNRGDVFLTDDSYEFRHEGPADDGDDDPDSTSHLRL